MGGFGWDVHRFIFAASTMDSSDDALLENWTAAVGQVRRLETLVLDGIHRGIFTSRSVHWRGRRPDGPMPPLLRTDWRITGVWENDWAELLLAALLWRCDLESLRNIGARLQLSVSMIDSIRSLQLQARQNLLTPQTAPPGAHSLHCAVVSQTRPEEFWERWPTGSGFSTFGELR